MKHDFKIGDEIWCVECVDTIHRSDGQIYISITKGRVQNKRPFIAINENNEIINDENREDFHFKTDAILHSLCWLENVFNRVLHEESPNKKMEI